MLKATVHVEGKGKIERGERERETEREREEAKRDKKTADKQENPTKGNCMCKACQKNPNTQAFSYRLETREAN